MALQKLTRNISFFGWLLLVGLLASCSSSDEEETIEANPLVDFEKQFSLRTLWSESVGDGVDPYFNRLRPAVSNGRVYAADKTGVVEAFDLETGDTVWQVKTEQPVSGGVTVAGDTILLGTKKGQLLALDSANGEQRWAADVSSEILAPPAAGEGKALARTTDGKLFAFDIVTGERAWFYDRTVPSLTLRGTAAPVIAPGGVFSGFANGKVAAFVLADGRLAWEQRITSPTGRSELQRLVDSDTTPLMFNDAIYIAGFNGNVIALNLLSGETLWSREMSTYLDMAADFGKLYVVHGDSHISALDRNTGALIWTQKDFFHRNITAPVVFGDYLVVGDYDGYLHFISREDGSHVTRQSIDGSGIPVAPIVADDKLVVLATDGTLEVVSRPQS